jgi:hypothetical protein
MPFPSLYAAGQGLLSLEGVNTVALFGGTDRADTWTMWSPLKLSAAISALAYAAGAAAVLWRKRAW